MRAALFPGQGIEASVVSAALDRTDPLTIEASELLGFDLCRRLEQAARRSRSTLPTSLAQPAIFVAGLASYRRRVAEGETFDLILGHSLGEYTALIAAGAISFRQGLALVTTRGKAMEHAALRSDGGMAAVLQLDLEQVETIASLHGVTLANDNAPGQAVISGERDALARAAAAVRENGGRCILLPVDGAFHSAAMLPTVGTLASSLFTVEVRMPSVPVISNVSAAPYRAPGEIRRLLELQLTGRVRFRESLLYLAGRGVTEFVDMGPGEVVGRIARSTVRTLEPADA